MRTERVIARTLLFWCGVVRSLSSVIKLEVTTITTGTRDVTRVDAYRTPSVYVLRESVRRAVEARSLRHVAREIGISHVGLKHFMNGAEPYVATKRRLLHWYVSRAAETRGISDDTASAAFAVLLDGLPPEARPIALSRMLEAVAQAHQQAGVPPPQWIESLSRRDP